MPVVLRDHAVPSTLPPELERIIFETAAHGSTCTMCRLVLVARRVRLWIEPMLYHTVILNNAGSARSFSGALGVTPRPVHTLFLANYPPIPARDTEQILARCAGATHFIVHARAPFPPEARPKRFTTTLDGLDGLLTRHTAFARLTHLVVHDSGEPWPEDALCALPSLTHLALAVYGTPRWAAHAARVRVLRAALVQCHVLTIAAVEFVRAAPGAPQVDGLLHALKEIDDPRLVVLFNMGRYSSPHQVMQEENDTWVRAARVVESQMRKAGGHVAMYTNKHTSAANL